MSNNTHGQDGAEDGEDGSEPEYTDDDGQGDGNDTRASGGDEAGRQSGQPSGETTRARAVEAALDAAADAGDLSDSGVEEAIATPGPADRTVTTDRLFEILSSPGNRFVLTFLLKADGAAEYADLVEYVVTRSDPPGEMTEAMFRGRVAATLINERLPELRDAGFVEIDSDRQTVAATPTAAVAAPHLALALSDVVAPTTQR